MITIETVIDRRSRMEQELLNEVSSFEYLMDAWKRCLRENSPSGYVLSDSLGTNLSRKEVDVLSDRVRAYLHAHGIGKNDFVLINLDRGVKPVVAIMGVWKNGSAFSLVESTYAKERIEFIGKDCGAKLELNEQVWEEILQTEPMSDYVIPDDHDACCCVYTSGTTGTPKGVLHEYGQIKLEMISEQMSKGVWKENPGSRWGLVAPLNFVASLKIVVHYIYSGGWLFVLDYDTVKNPKKLTAFFLKNQINGTFLSPSLLRLKGDNLGPFMQHVYTGSEPANNLFVKNVMLLNTYTMSESFFTVSRFIIDKPHPIVPIGNPNFELPIRLVDEDGLEVSEGETGDLCYFNPFCRGYVNNEVENEKHFIDSYFRTGDLAVFDGTQYILKGRSDDMIKIDGNRIEPSEIEAACRRALGLSNCAAKGYEKEGFVALYYTDDVKIDSDHAHTLLSELLPYYMIPAFYVKIDAMPLTKSGKLDRKGLNMPISFLKAPYIAPRDDFEKKLARIFSEVLEIDHIGIDDDFFTLGGSSIKVMELLSKLDEDSILTPSLIYKGRTISRISAQYKIDAASRMSPEEKEALGRAGRFPLSSNMHWYWKFVNDGSIDFYFGYRLAPFIPAGLLCKRLNNYIRSNSTFNMVLEPGEDGIPVMAYREESPLVSVETMNKSQLEELRHSFVRPFGYNEPLIRVRVVKCGLHCYLFYHAFHMITDGNGFHLMLDDLVSCLTGKEVAPTNFFAYAYEEHLRDQSKFISENLTYFNEKYFNKDYDICIKSDETTHQKGFGTSRAAEVSYEAVSEYCKKTGTSVNMFLVAAQLLTQSAFNGTDRNLCIWNFNNRGPKDTHAGMLVRGCYCAIDRSQISSLKELFTTIAKQNENTLWRVYEHDFYMDYEKTELVPTLALTYLEDWFTGAQLPLYLGTDLNLKNSNEKSEESEKVYCLTCSHDGKVLRAALDYGLSYNTPESVERYISMLEFAMNEMVNDRIPDFK